MRLPENSANSAVFFLSSFRSCRNHACHRYRRVRIWFFLPEICPDEKVIVYNWGDYIDPEIITMFEDETGIDVVYEEYETNEIMYPKVQSGAIAYDVVCPSDYMVQRMIENDLLAEINYENVPNLKYIDDIYMEMSKQYDPENKYSVPYLWGNGRNTL